jgi:hypothetical protein
MSAAREAKQREWQCNIFSQFSKKNENDLYLYEGAKGSKTPGFGSASKKAKDSISMFKILQPYIALDLINLTKDGYVANDNAVG